MRDGRDTREGFRVVGGGATETPVRADHGVGGVLLGEGVKWLVKASEQTGAEQRCSAWRAVGVGGGRRMADRRGLLWDACRVLDMARRWRCVRRCCAYRCGVCAVAVCARETEGPGGALPSQRTDRVTGARGSRMREGHGSERGKGDAPCRDVFLIHPYTPTPLPSVICDVC